jgi:hypothetical protein
VSNVIDTTHNRIEEAESPTMTPPLWDTTQILNDPEDQTIARILRTEFFEDLATPEFAATPAPVKRAAKRVADVILPLSARFGKMTLVCYPDDDSIEMIFDCKVLGKRITYMLQPDGEHVTTYFTGGASRKPRSGKVAFLPFADDAIWLIDPTGSRKFSSA